MITELHAAVISARNNIQWAHWNVTDYQIHHDITDPIYKYLVEMVDELAEIAIQHGESAHHPSEDKVIIRGAPLSRGEAVEAVGAVLNDLLASIQAANSAAEDIGVQNYLGQVYQDLSKWLNYFLIMTREA